jgi:hypothetical protein
MGILHNLGFARNESTSTPLRTNVLALCLPVRWKVMKIHQCRIRTEYVTNADNPIGRSVVGVGSAAQKTPIAIDPADQQYRMSSMEHIGTDVRLLVGIFRKTHNCPRVQNYEARRFKDRTPQLEAGNLLALIAVASRPSHK